MIALSASDFARITCFCRKSSDGDDSELWCVGGKLHVRYAKPDPCWPRGRTVWGGAPCNGACVATTDVRDLLKELPRIWDRGDGRKRRTPVHLDGTIRSLLRGTDPLAAALFEDGYCKRNSEWRHLCLDGRLHVKIHTDFAWANGGDDGFIHSVRCVPCDGGCKTVVEPDRAVISAIFREIRQMESDGEARRFLS